ncbi:hypothetical protein [Intestinimonas sp.]|uniref:hypothetical protein n=1 Tax=Intestinimonas sp. TaxID=1965293 RepID=UPI002622A705|nr:hypothetical protein [Intestinimonas sp.]
MTCLIGMYGVKMSVNNLHREAKIKTAPGPRYELNRSSTGPEGGLSFSLAVSCVRERSSHFDPENGRAHLQKHRFQGDDAVISKTELLQRISVRFLFRHKNAALPCGIFAVHLFYQHILARGNNPNPLRLSAVLLEEYPIGLLTGGAFAPYKRFAAGKTLVQGQFTCPEHF